MSVTVRHLNGDSTFLLTFVPDATSSPGLASPPTAFTVLIDPWLSGPSIVTAPWFAQTQLKTPSAITHLSQIDEPDIVIISQNKPDHCHKETLTQLRPEGKTVLAAEPSAARTIRGWNHFDPNRIHALSKYDPKCRFGRQLRLSIPPLAPDGSPGELCISFIPAKNYVTGMHNAFGLTYQPPTHTKSVASIATIDLPQKRTTRYFHMPLSPVTLPPSSPSPLISPPIEVRPMSFDQPRNPDRKSLTRRPSRSSQGPKIRPPQLSRSPNTASSEILPFPHHSIVPLEPKSDLLHGNVISQEITIPDPSLPIDSPFHFELDLPPSSFHTLPTPPTSPSPRDSVTSLGFSALPTAFSPTSSTRTSNPRTSVATSHQKSLSSVSSCPNLYLSHNPTSPITPARPKAISVIYSPHGVGLADLQPYIQHHLVRLPGALPLTILFHSFDFAQNPWYLGGNIMTGLPGGALIARALMARCWISAHDEVKDDRGISVKQLKVKRIPADRVRKYLWEGEQGQWLKKTGWTCDVRSLDVGKEMTIGPTRDLCSGLESNRESRLMRFGPQEHTDDE